ncbi:D-aminoacyl-tRNA deacylase [Flavobacteriaceae bacterium UJ101]|nr:D-aminoacyl-tRNA deacylase [Flavobacteriaceae bacterium UJ101]
MYTNIHTHHYYGEGLEILNTYPNDFIEPESYFSIGIHPWYIKEENIDKELSILEEVIKKSNCVAIGECGLDKNSKVEFSLQKEVFLKQLELAEKYSKPVIIHCVKAFGELISICKPFHHIPLIIHGYNKKQFLGEQLIKEGFFLSLGAHFQEKEELKNILKIHFNKIFFETDDKEVSIENIFKEAAIVLSKNSNEIKEEQFSKVKEIFNVR